MMPKKFKSPIIILIVLSVFIISFCVYYFIFTPKGSGLITRWALSKYLDSENIDIKEVDGNLAQTFSYKDIIIKDLKFLPKESILKIKKLDIALISFGPSGLNLNIHNGILSMPGFNTIFFYGTYQKDSFDINVYSKNVGVRETLDLFTQSSNLRKISGMISSFDVYIKGSLLEPQLSGTFEIEELSRDWFSITDCSGSLDIQLKDIKEELKIFGAIFLSKAIVIGPKGTLINLQESKIFFDGDPGKPSFDLKGISTIEGTKINIVLKGTLDKPELELTSEPSLSQERLLVMLATGKGWKGAERSFGSQQLSPDLVADFIDYFAFGGTGARIVKQLGISEISLKLDQNTKGIGIKKDVTTKTGVSYSVEQSQTEQKDATVTQKVGGEYTIHVDVRVIAATNKELRKAVEEKEFRDDLYYRLNVVPVYLPPLRDRKEDIPLLVDHFVEKFCKRMEKSINSVSHEAMDLLMEYDWPGNVRELENAIVHGFVRAMTDIIQPNNLPRDIREQQPLYYQEDRQDYEKKLQLLQVLERHNWHLGHAAEELGINRSTLWRRMKKYKIKK